MAEENKPAKQTGKDLSARHDLNYFKSPTSLQRWSLRLSIVAAGAALIWLGARAYAKNDVLYSKGPLSSAHAFIASRCDLCHSEIVDGRRSVGFQQNAADSACLACHDAPKHHASQKFTPSCSSCHVEHQGPVRLARVADQQCVQCHQELNSNLKDQAPPSKFSSNIHGFNKDHPEFSELKAPSPTAIVFPHNVHLEKKMLYPAPYPGEMADAKAIAVQLECTDCHRPSGEASGPWNYAQPGLQPVHKDSTPVRPLHPDDGRQLMVIPNYEQHCAGCHDLKFDPHFKESAEHPKQLQEVRVAMETRFREYIDHNLDELHRPSQAFRIAPEAQSPFQPKTKQEWVQQRLRNAEWLMKKKCQYCHKFEDGNAAAPIVKESRLKAPEMAHASFSHEAHVSVLCESCHANARSAESSSQWLLPGIKTCQRCHNGTPTEAGNAENGCFLCHQYHDWKSSPKRFRRNLTIFEMTGRMPPDPGHAEKP
jgi:hypothetical protein